jgi:hypothetical protein
MCWLQFYWYKLYRNEPGVLNGSLILMMCARDIARRF